MAMAARELGVTPSQVTKAIARLEKQMGTSLLVRSERGVSITDAGHLWAAEFAQWVRRSRALHRQGHEQLVRMTVAATPLLHELLLPPLAASVDGLMLRGVQLLTRHIRALISERLFELALLQDEVGWLPQGWSARRVGTIRSALYASPETAASFGHRLLTTEDVSRLRFVGPISLSESGELVAGDDGCPIPLSRRRIGHETQTISSALEIAALTNQVVFGPELAARHHVEAGRLVEVPVEGWDIQLPLHLACAEGQVKASVFERLLQLLQSGLPRVERDAAA
jgi:DNA-binding transcriptional LysR family regulator